MIAKTQIGGKIANKITLANVEQKRLKLSIINGLRNSTRLSFDGHPKENFGSVRQKHKSDNIPDRYTTVI